MRNSLNLLFILKRSSLCNFLICMTVPLTTTITTKYRYSVKQKMSITSQRWICVLSRRALYLFLNIVKPSPTCKNGSNNSSAGKTTSSSFGLVPITNCSLGPWDRVVCRYCPLKHGSQFLRRRFSINISSSATLFSIILRGTTVKIRL